MAELQTSSPRPHQRSGGAAYAAKIDQDSGHRDKSRSVKPLKHIWPFVAKYKSWVMWFLVFLTLSSIATLTLPALVRVIADCGFGEIKAKNIEMCTRINVGGAQDLAPYFKLGLIFAVIYSIVGPMRAFLINTLGQRVIADLRNAVYSHLLTLNPAYYEKVRTGEVLSRLTTDTTLIETVVTGSISFGIRALATGIGAIFLMFFTNWKMALMVVAMLPLILIPVIILGRLIRNLSRDGQDRIADASARAGESLSAIQTVQAFTRETFEDLAFTKVVNDTYDVQRKRIVIRTILTSIISFVALGGIMGIMWFGATEVIAERMTGGQILQFFLYSSLALMNFSFLTETWTNLLRAAGASERLVEILQVQPDITVPENPVMPKSPINIKFGDVGFNYPSRPDDVVLKGVSFDVKSGETVAFVGPSGAGKSTLFQLMLRFYDVSKGAIKLGDVGIAEIDPKVLREQFAIVQQNTPLFSGSAMDNIRYGREGSTDAEVIAAAKAAYADEFIMALPEGYQTDLGERATTLSGGQRQRIAIARAILRDAPILLLDEATSALDAESEQAVQKAFEALAKDRTTLVIAHRLATVKQADRIVVMDKGQIVGQGTHSALMRKGGLYARLAKLQFNTG